MAVSNSGIELPEWLFDVDDEDDVDNNNSLLQELDIDLSHIYR